MRNCALTVFFNEKRSSIGYIKRANTAKKSRGKKRLGRLYEEISKTYVVRNAGFGVRFYARFRVCAPYQRERKIAFGQYEHERKRKRGFVGV